MRRLIRDSLRLSKRRKEFYLFTKLGHDGKSFGKPDWDVSMLALSIDRSLRRLQTDHVDLLQLHSCGLDMLKKGDVIRSVNGKAVNNVKELLAALQTINWQGRANLIIIRNQHEQELTIALK